MLFRIAGLIIILAFIVKAKCQDKIAESNDRIVGGVVQEIATRRFQVAVEPFGYLCGGSLISWLWVLSAGHCVYEEPIDTMIVRAGSNHFNSGGLTRNVNGTYLHSCFDPNTLACDISMILLMSPFSYSSTINTIARATGLPAAYSTVIVSGYGTTSEGGTVAPQLMSVQLQLFPDSTCKGVYKDELTSSMFCAGVPAGGKDSCQGDSGGPITYNGYLIGVVSWGYGCATKEYPGIYTRVPMFKDWISTTMSTYS